MALVDEIERPHFPPCNLVQMASLMYLLRNYLDRFQPCLATAIVCSLLLVLPGCQSGRGLFWARKQSTQDEALAHTAESLDELVDSSYDANSLKVDNTLPEGFSPARLPNQPQVPLSKPNAMIKTAVLSDAQAPPVQLASKDHQQPEIPEWTNGLTAKLQSETESTNPLAAEVEIRPRPMPTHQQTDNALVENSRLEPTSATVPPADTSTAKPTEPDFEWANELAQEFETEIQDTPDHHEPVVSFDFELQKAPSAVTTEPANDDNDKVTEIPKVADRFEPVWEIETQLKPASIVSGIRTSFGNPSPNFVQNVSTHQSTVHAQLDFTGALGKAAPVTSQVQVTKRKAKPLSPVLVSAASALVPIKKTTTRKPGQSAVSDDTLSALIASLESADELTRPSLTMQLLMYPTLSETRSDCLAKLSHHEDTNTAAVAQIALSLEGKGGKDYSKVGELLKSGEPEIATKAAYLISKVTSDSPLVDQLQAGLQSDSIMVKVHCAEGLFQHGRGSDEAWFVLAEAATDTRSEIQQLAIHALGTIRKVHTQDTIDLLVQIMQAEEIPIQIAAILALGHFEHQAKRCLPGLMTLAEQTESFEVKRAILLTVKRIQIADQHVAVEQSGWHSRTF